MKAQLCATCTVTGQQQRFDLPSRSVAFKHSHGSDSPTAFFHTPPLSRKKVCLLIHRSIILSNHDIGATNASAPCSRRHLSTWPSFLYYLYYDCIMGSHQLNCKKWSHWAGRSWARGHDLVVKAAAYEVRRFTLGAVDNDSQMRANLSHLNSKRRSDIATSTDEQLEITNMVDRLPWARSELTTWTHIGRQHCGCTVRVTGIPSDLLIAPGSLIHHWSLELRWSSTSCSSSSPPPPFVTFLCPPPLFSLGPCYLFWDDWPAFLVCFKSLSLVVLPWWISVRT